MSDGQPPVLRTWPRAYAFVLVVLVALIALFSAISWIYR